MFCLLLSLQRVPTSAFKPVEPAQSRGRKENRASSSSPVRRILEGVSKKLQKSQSPDTKRRPPRPQKPRDRSSGRDRAKPRPRTDPRRAQKERSRRPSSVRKPLRDAARPRETKPKRRSSMRLKTLAKILGRKRPNYSLVLSGYADMEEYEEEQKKKAAKSALAKAKAEARARASTRRTASAARLAVPKEPEKMRTRSSSVVVEEAAKSGDKERAAPGALKRSLSSGSMGKKEQTPLAAIVETKRLKREGVRDTEGKEENNAGSRRQSRDSVRKSVPATLPLSRRGRHSFCISPVCYGGTCGGLGDADS